MNRKGPEITNPEPRNYSLEDVDPQALYRFANNQLSPRLRILFSQTQPIISPRSLRSAFTEAEIRRLFNPREEVAAWHELGDVGQLPAMNRLSGRPMDSVMVVSHMRDSDADVVETTPANITQLHGEHFSTDPVTQALVGYITTNLYSPKPGKDITAHVIEYPGNIDDSTLEALNSHAGGGNMLGIDLPSRFDRPDLGHALQSAVARCQAKYPCLPSVIVTSSPGPSGQVIVVHSAPGNPTVLTEGLPSSPVYGAESEQRAPVQFVMVRPRFHDLKEEDE